MSVEHRSAFNGYKNPENSGHISIDANFQRQAEDAIDAPIVEHEFNEDLCRKYLESFLGKEIAEEMINPTLTGEQPTLRDQFAMATLSGILSNPEMCGSADKIAGWAYEQADAMLEARNKKVDEDEQRS